jgi:hypothetical protein
MGKRARKELQTVEAFEKALREEISVSAEFDLPLSVLALIIKGGWEEGAVRQALDVLRTADLVAQPDSEELLVALPNTKAETALVVEERLRKAVPEATFGVAAYRRGDAAEDLLKRPRAAARRVTEEESETP